MRYRLDRTMIFCAASASLMLLSACGGSGPGNNLAQMDNQIAQADIDPAVSSAIEDEILVDPALVQQSNPNGVRHPERPLQAPYPLEKAGEGAVKQAGGRDIPIDPREQIAGACGAPFQYGPEWAERLPAEFPPYPGGRVTEAAGINRGDCRMRVVTFTTAHSWQQVLDWYRGAAVRAGFNFEHQAKGADHVLGGVNQRTDGAYYLIVTPEQGGSRVALIVNNGR
jgi:hypothetical protein